MGNNCNSRKILKIWVFWVPTLQKHIIDFACWPLIPKFAGSNPAKAIGFLKGDKNPQHAFLRKGSKIIGPMSQICGMLKDPVYISGQHFRPEFLLWLLGDYRGLWTREAPGGQIRNN
jgi:hypothetical protein